VRALIAWLRGLLLMSDTPAPIRPPLDALSRDTLIRTAWGEVRGETEAGQIAFVHVVANRSAKSGLSPHHECLKPSQFSCHWDAQGPRLRALQLDDPVYRALAAVVDRAWAMPDTVRGARHYYAPAAMKPPGRVPGWAQGKEPCAAIGGHRFFNDVA
jgi:N-acetylmuramoyl-L-alanine amidase